MRFSKWLESMQKDVECTFGILKGRFRILKTGIPLHGVEATDRIWMTCCALHNFLLREDRMDERWDSSRYLGVEGHHYANDIQRYLGLDRPVRDVVLEQSLFDTSGMGPGDDGGDNENDVFVNEMIDESSDVVEMVCRFVLYL